MKVFLNKTLQTQTPGSSIGDVCTLHIPRSGIPIGKVVIQLYPTAANDPISVFNLVGKICHEPGTTTSTTISTTTSSINLHDLLLNI